MLLKVKIWSAQTETGRKSVLDNRRRKMPGSSLGATLTKLTLVISTVGSITSDASGYNRAFIPGLGNLSLARNDPGSIVSSGADIRSLSLKKNGDGPFEITVFHF